MTDSDLKELLCTQSPRKALQTLSSLSEKDRRAGSKCALKLYKKVIAKRFAPEPDTSVRHEDSVVIGVLATRSLSELRTLSISPLPREIKIQDIFVALQPGWTQQWVEALVESSPYLIFRLAPLWEAGLCTRPDSDAFILDYYTHHGQGVSQMQEPLFLKRDVWRLFEVEGGGEFSLAAHDKYASPENGWSTRLVDLVAAGKLDRNGA